MEIVRRELFPCRLTPEGILEHLAREVNGRLPEWRTRVAGNPECFGQVEEEVLGWSRGVAGLLTAAVLDDGEVQERVEERAEAIRREAPGGQQKGYRRARHIKLLCGLVLTVLCWYCRPRTKRGK